MSFVHVELKEGAFTPTDKTQIVTASWSWADIQDVLSAEWEIGGSALPAGAIRGLVADK